jgi:tripartite-type tricarboxylate transporter receptor subunit TctC
MRSAIQIRWMVAMCAVVLAPSVVCAEPVSDFYAGKRLTFIVSSTVGGGYDQYARLLARHIVRHIPGNPSSVVQNMVGAEGITAANYLARVAPQDGTAIGGLSRNVGLVQLYEPNSSAIQFNARTMHWIGSPQQEIGTGILSTRKGLRTIDDLKTREATSGSTARNAPTSVYPRMLNALYGTKIKPIEGYPGSPEALIAFERGEVEVYVSGGTSAPTLARMVAQVDSGNARVFVQMGMKRNPRFADVPTAIDLVNNPDHKRMFEIAFTDQVMGRPFVVATAVPGDRVAALRTAFDATMKDDAFLAEAKKQKMDIDPVSGADINTLLERVYSSPPALIQQMLAIVR